MRILVDIPGDDFKLLKLVTQELSLSRAEFVRQGIAAHLALYDHTMNYACGLSRPGTTLPSSKDSAQNGSHVATPFKEKVRG